MNRNVLIVPMQPTPNGRLHIGHGAGTYLRADTLARSLRLQGYSVRVITGSDVFENWVLAETLRDGKDPDTVCDLYHKGIQQDLKLLNIRLDTWIDPRAESHFAGYLDTHEKTLLTLQNTGNATLVSERVPYSAETGDAIIGTWIAGSCPYCNKPCGGSSCVYCGAHFQPEEIVQPRSRLDNSTLEWRTIESWFVTPNEQTNIIESLKRSGVRPIWMQAAERYLSLRKGRIRLTGPGTWGIRSNLVPEGFVLSNPYYLYSVYCGEVYKLLEGTEVNPFMSNSNVTTIGVFGNDNSTPGLIAPHVISQGTEGLYKPFDYTLVNGMLFLEGEKCSTSKRHGIWIKEILDPETEISSDEIRYFLSHTSLDTGAADIKITDFIDSVMSFRQWCVHRLDAALETVRHSESFMYSDRIANAVAEQSESLFPGKFDLKAATVILDNWMQDGSMDRREWLLGLPLLGAPIIPTISSQVWRQLGLDGEPCVEVAKGRAIRLEASRLVEFPDKKELTETSLRPFIHLAGIHT